MIPFLKEFFTGAQGFRLGSETGPRILSGSGSPEGAVTAPIGSMYSRTDGGTNTATYRKESGTDNTGWVADSAAAGGGGGSSDSRMTRLLTDFTHTNAVQDDFLIAIIGTGSNFATAPVAAALVPDHPGVLQWRSGTTANSGVQCVTLLAHFRIGGGEQWDFNWRTAPVLTTVTMRSGAIDSNTATAPVDGVFFEMAASGNVVGICRSNNVQTASPTIATLAVSTWYHFRITVNAGGTSVTFQIFDDAGVSQGSQAVTTNIPTAAGRVLGWGSVVTSSGTVAIELGHADRMLLTNPGRTVQRGAA